MCSESTRVPTLGVSADLLSELCTVFVETSMSNALLDLEHASGSGYKISSTVIICRRQILCKPLYDA